MLKKHSISSYALIAGLATVLFLPITADADRAADRAMKKDGFGLDSTRGNNSVAESLRQADGHSAGAPTTFDDGLMGAASGMNPGMPPMGNPGMNPGMPPMGQPEMNQGMVEPSTVTKPFSDTILRNHAPTQAR